MQEWSQQPEPLLGAAGDGPRRGTGRARLAASTPEASSRWPETLQSGTKSLERGIPNCQRWSGRKWKKIQARGKTLSSLFLNSVSAFGMKGLGFGKANSTD